MLLTYITKEGNPLLTDELSQKRLEWELNAIFKKYDIVALQGGESPEAIQFLLENISNILENED